MTGRLMVKTGQMTVIRQMTYQPIGRHAATVETMTFDRLRELNDGGTQRADFHVLAIVDAGCGSVTVSLPGVRRRQPPNQEQPCRTCSHHLRFRMVQRLGVRWRARRGGELVVPPAEEHVQQVTVIPYRIPQ